MKYFVDRGIRFPKLKNFEICTLEIESKALKKNPLKDSNIRWNPFLVPKSKPNRKRGFPVVVVLAGFTGNGPNYFSMRTFEDNFPQVIDRQYSNGLAPKSIYFFVDAMTSWGGSQFLNSKGTGHYEDYIIQELVEVLKSDPDISKDPKDWIIMGGSSGGYGALHLASKYPNVFSRCAAIAPDSMFETVYLNDFYQAAGRILSEGGSKKILQQIKDGSFKKSKGWHEVINALGMAACYSPGKYAGDLNYPIDLKTGKLNPIVWKKWKKHDPVEFLKSRAQSLKKLRSIFLEVGTKDEFNLQFGAREIHKILKSRKIKCHYHEYSGGHFDLSSRRPSFLEWANKQL